MKKSIKPAINPNLIAARKRDFSLKLFYALMRQMRESGEIINDIGSSIEVDPTEYPLINSVLERAHRQSIELGEYTEYSSSWGTPMLRKAVANFFTRRGANVCWEKNVMVTRGIISAVKKVVEAMDITHVIMPSMAPYFPETTSLIEGRKIIPVSLDVKTGKFNLQALQDRIQKSGAEKGKVLMYVTHPAAPSGALMPDDFIRNELLPFLKKNYIWLFSDSYVVSTRFDGKPMRPILSFPGAIDYCVEAISISKEIGLPGVGASGIVGNFDIIEAVRLQSALVVDMIPLPQQRMAAMALDEISPDISARRVIQEFKQEIKPRLQKMGWPFIEPQAGFDFLLRVPPRFFQEGVTDPALFASFSILKHFGVAFVPCTFVHKKEDKHFLRIVLKQKIGKIPRVLDMLAEKSFSWEKFQPNEADVEFLNNQIQNLDLTKL